MVEIGLHSTSLLYNSGFNLSMYGGLSFYVKAYFSTMSVKMNVACYDNC